MFIEFFYFLKDRGFKVSLSEWMTLLDGLEHGLHGSSIDGFYYLCRAVLVHTEADYDRFDQAFLSFFNDVPYTGEITEEMLSWLNKPSIDLGNDDLQLQLDSIRERKTDDVIEMFRKKLCEQDSEHNGGTEWVGTQGRSPFGNNGYSPNGMRVGGESHHHIAFQVASERRFKDFRTDQTLDVRHFQMAFRRLRQLSSNIEDSEMEFDIDGTIHNTANKGGMLDITYKPPRKNRIKVLLLMDSGGSMDAHTGICNEIFQAATKSNTFKELHVYYFHNLVFEKLYKEPTVTWHSEVDVQSIYNKYGPEYKVIFVGDAMMNPYEMFEKRRQFKTNEMLPSGLETTRDFISHYPYSIWLNPMGISTGPARILNRSRIQMQQELPMFPLTLDGLEAGIKSLMVRK